MKAEATIKRQVRKLRKLVETTDDKVVARIAYAMETALQWVLYERTTGWVPMDVEAKKEAEILRKELHSHGE